MRFGKSKRNLKEEDQKRSRVETEEDQEKSEQAQQHLIHNFFMDQQSFFGNDDESAQFDLNAHRDSQITHQYFYNNHGNAGGEQLRNRSSSDYNKFKPRNLLDKHQPVQSKSKPQELKLDEVSVARSNNKSALLLNIPTPRDTVQQSQKSGPPSSENIEKSQNQSKTNAAKSSDKNLAKPKAPVNYKEMQAERRKQTMQQIKKEKEKEDNTKLEKKPRPNTLWKGREKAYKPMVLEFPIEGKLLVYFSSVLILNGSYDQAIRVLTQIGLSYYFDGTRGICNKANVQKLLAIAYFYKNSNFHQVKHLLQQAENKFTSLNILHGIAVCQLAKA